MRRVRKDPPLSLERIDTNTDHEPAPAYGLCKNGTVEP